MTVQPRETQAVKIALMQKDICSIQDDVRVIRQRLEGNGKRGLIERTDEIERTLASYFADLEKKEQERKEAQEDKHDITKRLMLLLIGSVITQIVSIVFNLLQR